MARITECTILRWSVDHTASLMHDTMYSSGEEKIFGIIIFLFIYSWIRYWFIFIFLKFCNAEFIYNLAIVKIAWFILWLFNVRLEVAGHA